jgi:hypothetical protein
MGHLKSPVCDMKYILETVTDTDFDCDDFSQMYCKWAKIQGLKVWQVGVKISGSGPNAHALNIVQVPSEIPGRSRFCLVEPQKNTMFCWYQDGSTPSVPQFVLAEYGADFGYDFTDVYYLTEDCDKNIDPYDPGATCSAPPWMKDMFEDRTGLDLETGEPLPKPANGCLNEAAIMSAEAQCEANEKAMRKVCADTAQAARDALSTQFDQLEAAATAAGCTLVRPWRPPTPAEQNQPPACATFQTQYLALLDQSKQVNKQSNACYVNVDKTKAACMAKVPPCELPKETEGGCSFTCTNRMANHAQFSQSAVTTSFNGSVGAACKKLCDTQCATWPNNLCATYQYREFGSTQIFSATLRPYTN